MSDPAVVRRIHEVAAERGVNPDVVVVAGAQRALTDPPRADFDAAVDEPVAARVPVSACLSFALSLDATDALARRGIQLEATREAHLRYTLAGATVITI